PHVSERELVRRVALRGGVSAAHVDIEAGGGLALADEGRVDEPPLVPRGRVRDAVDRRLGAIAAPEPGLLERGGYAEVGPAGRARAEREPEAEEAVEDDALVGGHAAEVGIESR